MATPVLGLKDDFADGDAIDTTFLNPVAETLEYLFAGYLEKDVAGSVNITLDEADEARNRVLKLTGVLTGSISLILPGWNGKDWLIWNATTGSYSVTVKTAAGAGIVITQGYAAVVYGDGTDIKRGSADVMGDELRLASPRIVTAILDSNGNELLKLVATASAVNELQLTNGATGVGPILEATGETNVDVTLRGKGSGGVQLSRSGGKLGFFGAALVARAAALTQTFATADRTLSAYTADNESGAYTGIDNAQGATPYATVADLNALRTAYENLRAFTEDLAQFTNALVDDLQSYGLEQ